MTSKPSRAVVTVVFAARRVARGVTVVSVGTVLGLVGPAHAQTRVDFGTMDTAGNDLKGWAYGANSGLASEGNPFDGSSFFRYAGHKGGGWLMGTSDGDALVAGHYAITFEYGWYAGVSSQLRVEAFAWDGRQQTLLGWGEPTMNTDEKQWSRCDLSFSVSRGAREIGQALQLRFRSKPPATTGSYIGIDNIAATVTTTAASGPPLLSP